MDAIALVVMMTGVMTGVMGRVQGGKPNPTQLFVAGKTNECSRVRNFVFPKGGKTTHG